MEKVLIVDDELEIADLINDILTDEGYSTVVKNSGYEALKELEVNHYDLVLLDIMLPDITGMEVCNIIREKIDTPIIFISAKNKIEDKVSGLEVGADDYITKPFNIDELVARVKAHIRRNNRVINIQNKNHIKIKDIEINKDTYEVKKKNKIINLSNKEFELLYYLMSNAGTILSKEQIYNNVWQSEYGDMGTVAVNIKSLRKKLDTKEEYIITIYGLGYKFIKG